MEKSLEYIIKANKFVGAGKQGGARRKGSSGEYRDKKLGGINSGVVKGGNYGGIRKSKYHSRKDHNVTDEQKRGDGRKIGGYRNPRQGTSKQGGTLAGHQPQRKSNYLLEKRDDGRKIGGNRSPRQGTFKQGGNSTGRQQHRKSNYHTNTKSKVSEVPNQSGRSKSDGYRDQRQYAFKNDRALKGRNDGGITKSNQHKIKRGISEAPNRSNIGGLLSANSITKLHISNLDYGVSESDIRELFEDFGVLQSASLHFNSSGQSLGTADVVFQRRIDATKAINAYNGVRLDGRPMNIQFLTSDIPESHSIKSRLGYNGMSKSRGQRN